MDEEYTPGSSKRLDALKLQREAEAKGQFD